MDRDGAGAGPRHPDPARASEIRMTVDMLPESDQGLDLESVKKLVLACSS